MKPSLALILLFAAAPARAAAPAYQWFPSNELYFSAPFFQAIHYPAGGKTAQAGAWAFGYRAIGNGDGVGKTGGLQLQKLTVNSGGAGVKGSFYLLEMLAGAEYISPWAQDKPLRFTAGLLANAGLADTTLFVAPMLTAGLLYQTAATQVPGGFSLAFYYRFTDIDLDDAAGKPGTLRPALGFRLGYIFKGFWAPKEKSTT
ncbi:MAG: hypothetical protein Q7R35_10135 [Elusimicrobiota bacterium]|nr:hypothetical protein [Elusimicrobiota bacterium]